MSFCMTLDRGRVLRRSGPPLVMGVLNCTDDSFYPDSRVESTETALHRAERMIEAGADILDIGGESTRPGSMPVSAEAELERTQPVVRAIREQSDIPISIDTQKASVAQAALEAGADIINDVSALRTDEQMLPLAIERKAPVVLMHMLGTPQTMQNSPEYDDPVREILHCLIERANEVIKAGIDRERIILDPGIGFGKRLEDNLRLLADLAAFSAPEFPLLVGASRKSFIGKILARDSAHAGSNRHNHGDENSSKPEESERQRRRNSSDIPVQQRLSGSLAVHVMAALKGADILRVHDVAETVDVIRMVQAIIDAGDREARGVSVNAVSE